jgi:HSP20 family protein
MTLVKFKSPRLPWYDTMFSDLLGTDRLFTKDFLLDDKWVPAMNIKETDEKFVIDVAVPGFNKKDFNVVIENGVLRIAAEREAEKEETGENFTRKEFNYSGFNRSFTLPENVNEDEKIKANYKNGILKIELTKLPMDVLTHKRVIEIE